jgi:S-DNA-T family DNA segregation ATPase FtsK/SpoIIIE
MAKKKKPAPRKKKVYEAEVLERSPFWALSGAVLLMLAGFLLLLGLFGTGGPLPVNMYKGAYWAFGWAAVLTPVALVYWGVYKFKSEDRRIPLGNLVSMLLLLLFASGWAQSAFATKAADGNWSGGHGGQVGSGAGNAVLAALDKVPASLVFFVFALLAAFFAFGVSLQVLAKLVEPFRKKEPSEDDLAALKAKASEQPGFKLNEGVPVVHHTPGEAQKLSTLKNTAQKLTAGESHEALVTASDPDWQFPSLDLLNQKQDKADAGDVNANAQAIHDTFANFNIEVEMEGANIGPRVTQYTLKPPTGGEIYQKHGAGEQLGAGLGSHGDSHGSADSRQAGCGH